jgi:hypothetical protein
MQQHATFGGDGGDSVTIGEYLKCRVDWDTLATFEHPLTEFEYSDEEEPKSSPGSHSCPQPQLKGKKKQQLRKNKYIRDKRELR